MTLRHMRIFVAVCECGSITGAARRLYLAQPAVSQAVRELEEYYGVRFFDRMSRHIYLTEEGKRLFGYASHITALFDEMEQGMKDWDAAGSFRIGASITIGTHLLPEMARRFAEKYPAIQMHVTIENSADVEHDVRENRIDIGLIEGSPRDAALVSIPFLDDSLVLICGPAHPFFSRESVTLEELSRQPLLLREKTSGTRQFVDSMFLAHDLAVEPVWESVSTRALVSAVSKGLGVSVLPLRLVEEHIRAGLIACVAVENISFYRQFSAIHHKNKYLTRGAQSFLELCRTAGEGECRHAPHAMDVKTGVGRM